jgi:hypothetical protein
MNHLIKAIIIGITIEGALFYVWYWAAGPYTPLGALLTLPHLPALLLSAPFGSLGLPKWTFLTLLFILASLCWTLIAHAFLAKRRR